MRLLNKKGQHYLATWFSSLTLHCALLAPLHSIGFLYMYIFNYCNIGGPGNKSKCVLSGKITLKYTHCVFNALIYETDFPEHLSSPLLLPSTWLSAAARGAMGGLVTVIVTLGIIPAMEHKAKHCSHGMCTP